MNITQEKQKGDEVASYNIFTWNHTNSTWKLRFKKVKFWQPLAKRINKLYSEGWSEVSILVERI